jgi:hypothetical protein
MGIWRFSGDGNEQYQKAWRDFLDALREAFAMACAALAFFGPLCQVFGFM